MNKPCRVPETETPSPGVADNLSFNKFEEALAKSTPEELQADLDEAAGLIEHEKKWKAGREKIEQS